MASLENVKQDIADIAGRDRNVRFSEIERIVNQLGVLGHSVRIKRTRETVFVMIDGERFTVCEHHRGSSQLKPVYVRAFLKAAINLGLYEG